MESEWFKLKGLDKTQCDLCQSCLNTTKCVDCDVPRCQKCCSVHLKGIKSDRIETKKDLDYFTQVAVKCETHSSEDLLFYCETCQICICTKCSVSGHEKHEFVKVKDIVQRIEQRLSEVLASIRYTQIPLMKSKVKSVASSREENRKQGEITVQKINSRMDELVQEINKLRQKLIDESNELEEQNNVQLNEIEALLSVDLSNMESLYNECKCILLSGSHIDKILTEQKVCSELDEINSHDTDIVLALPLFYSGKIDVKSFQNSFGYIDTQMLSSSDFQTSTFITEEANVDIVSSFNHKSKDVLSILTLSDDKAWVHCRGEFDNEEVSKDGIIENTISFDYMINDLACLSDNEIFVSAGNTSYIYKMTQENKTLDIIDTSPLQSLCLCVSKDGNILTGLVEKWSFTIKEDSRRLIARMDTSGEILETYEYDGESRLFVLLWGVAENKNGDICVVNKISMTKGHLVILEGSGKLKATYNGGHMDKHFDATDVECDDLGFVIVSDCRNRKIHLLNGDGQLIQYLMTSKNMIHNPDALCLDKNGYLWIGCHSGQIIVVKYLD